MNLIFLGWHVPAAYDFALETRTLARVRAHLFSRKLTGILVVRHPAMADPEAVE